MGIFGGPITAIFYHLTYHLIQVHEYKRADGKWHELDVGHACFKDIYLHEKARVHET